MGQPAPAACNQLNQVAKNYELVHIGGAPKIVAFLKQHPTLQGLGLDLNERISDSAFMLSNFYTVETIIAGLRCKSWAVNGCQQMGRPQTPKQNSLSVGFPLLRMGVLCGQTMEANS